MTSYRETFRRHRRLLSAPIVLAGVLALWSVLGAPKMYQSTASLWVDNPPPASSSLTNSIPGAPTPAEEEQAVVGELLKTRGFRLTVGHDSPLAKYLATSSNRGWGPTALLSSLKGGGTLDDRILAALSGKRIASSIAGPQVLQLTYQGPSPAVAQATLASVLKQLQRQSVRLDQLRGRGAVAYYRGQVDAANKALVNARQATSGYLSQHAAATASSDPTLKALKQAETGAANRLARATTQLTQATGAVAAPAGTANGVEIIDPPGNATSAHGGKKKALLALFGGLFAGALISFLGTVALTPSRPGEHDRAAPPSPADSSGWPDSRESQFEAFELTFTGPEASAADDGESTFADLPEPVKAAQTETARRARGRKRTQRVSSSGNGSSPAARERRGQPRNGSSPDAPASPDRPDDT